jgi:hypothetical protein
VETEEKSRHVMEHKGSLYVEFYTVVKAHIHFCLEEGCKMFSEISVLTYQPEKKRNPEERKMNNEEIVLLTNTEISNAYEICAGYFMEKLEKLRTKSGKNKEEEAKRKCEVVDIQGVSRL